MDPILPETDERPVFVTLPFAKMTNPHYFDEEDFAILRNIPDVVKFPIKSDRYLPRLPAFVHVMKAELAHSIPPKEAEDSHKLAVVAFLRLAIGAHGQKGQDS